jgi:hypothetical protein
MQRKLQLKTGGSWFLSPVHLQLKLASFSKLKSWSLFFLTWRGCPALMYRDFPLRPDLSYIFFCYKNPHMCTMNRVKEEEYIFHCNVFMTLLLHQGRKLL